MKYEITDEKLLDAQILRFTLQPLIENAIFHGIEPSRHRGIILIRVWAEDKDLFLMVQDNGIGMNQTKLENLMCHSGHTDQMSGIGLRNIHERIFMDFGEPYGLRIESTPGEYTRIYIRMPLFYETPPGKHLTSPDTQDHR